VTEMRKPRRILLLTFSLFLVSLQQPSFAMQGGTDAVGDTRVVALVFGQNTRASCSGVPLAPLVVLAAAHCLSNQKYLYTSETYLPSGLSVSAPGADLTKEVQSNRPQVIKVALTSGFIDTSFKDDLAFYFLNKPLVGATFLSIASLDELAQVKKQSQLITHIGYGYIAPGKIEDYKPHAIELTSSPLSSSRFGYSQPDEATSISSDETPGHALCLHDSGGPFIANIAGKEKLLAINLRGDGCDRNGPNSPVLGTLGISPVPYLDLLQRQWKIVMTGLGDVQGVLETSAAIDSLINSARAVPIPSPTPSAEQTPVVSKAPVAAKPKNLVTITCVKGKVIVKLSGVKPVCGSGFKKISK